VLKWDRRIKRDIRVTSTAKPTSAAAAFLQYCKFPNTKKIIYTANKKNVE
jgi:hypothetical protein